PRSAPVRRPAPCLWHAAGGRRPGPPPPGSSSAVARGSTAAAYVRAPDRAAVPRDLPAAQARAYAYGTPRTALQSQAEAADSLYFQHPNQTDEPLTAPFPFQDQARQARLQLIYAY